MPRIGNVIATEKSFALHERWIGNTRREREKRSVSHRNETHTHEAPPKGFPNENGDAVDYQLGIRPKSHVRGFLMKFFVFFFLLLYSLIPYIFSGRWKGKVSDHLATNLISFIYKSNCLFISSIRVLNTCVFLPQRLDFYDVVPPLLKEDQAGRKQKKYI